MQVEERQRDSSGRENLEAGDVAEHERTEGEDHAGDERRLPVAGPVHGEEVGAEGRTDEGQDPHYVVGEYRIRRDKIDRRAEERLRDEELGVGQGLSVGIEDVCIKKAGEIPARQASCLPGKGPDIQQRIAVWSCHSAGEMQRNRESEHEGDE